MKRILLMACLSAVVMGAQAEKKYRNFTNTEGKTIRGCIKAYDARTQTVMIERDNKKNAKVPITVFSEADQAYIRDWEVLRCFATKSTFKISAKRNRAENEGRSSSDHNSEIIVTDTYYEILLDNRSTSEIKGLELEYCIFYEQEQKTVAGKAVQGVYCGKIPIGFISMREKKTLKTKAVSIYKEELDSNWAYGSYNNGAVGIDNVQNGDVHGIWIRVHLKLPSGQTEMREFCYPDSIDNSRSWTTSSVRAGMN